MSKEELFEKIIIRLGDKSTFGFNELRLDKRVHEEFCDDDKIKNTLELFSFGSLKDYDANKDDFVQLSSSALFKLSQLTLISEVLTNNEFSYNHLRSILHIQSTPDLERLITESIYSGILDAKLFNEQELVKVYSSIGRDILLDDEPGSKYGSNRRASDLIRGLELFGSRVGKGLEYITEVDDNITRDAQCTAASMATSFSSEQTSGSETTSSSGQAISSYNGSGTSPMNNKRKRPIDPK